MTHCDTTHTRFMQQALQQARHAYTAHEVPVGAVIVQHDVIIAKGYNRMESSADATAHAEIIAIGAAGNALQDWRLDHCTLYVTLEPCCMCLGAICTARIPRVVYAATDPRRGAVDSSFFRQEIQHVYRYFPDILGGVCAQQSSTLLQTFFKDRVR